jgi:hypothetical protein
VSNQVPNVKLPGETDPAWAKVVSEYLSKFKKYHVEKTHKNELYQWCADHMGEKYKDWSIYEGGAQDRVWVVMIRDPKKGMFFELRWTEIIVKTIDRSTDK